MGLDLIGREGGGGVSTGKGFKGRGLDRKWLEWAWLKPEEEERAAQRGRERCGSGLVRPTEA